MAVLFADLILKTTAIDLWLSFSNSVVSFSVWTEEKCFSLSSPLRKLKRCDD